MSLRLTHAWLLLGLLIAGDAFALGLGDIRLSSALNEPLRAEIELLSATPEELENLKVQLASAATFDRYGLDRPLYLTRLSFRVGRGAGGDVVRISSQEPLTEPFVTFLIEATWPSGRLLREYTVLLDPPTFAPPPAAQSSQAVTAPSRADPADSGRIERPPEPQRAPAVSEPAADPAPRASAPFDSAPGDELEVQRGDTLWGIAQRVRPDERLSMNQTMLAIYEANPRAFAGNINRLTAGARLRIPSADDIYRISRSDAISEVQRQNSAVGLEGPAARPRPSLTLVPPDREQEDYDGGVSGERTDPAGAGALETRIRELERTVADQQSLIEIRDSELARLRDELARMRAQGADEAADEIPSPQQPAADAAVPEEPSDEVFADDSGEIEAADDEPAAPEPGDPVSDSAAEDDAAATPVAQPAPRVVRSAPEPGLVERIVAALTGIWGIIGLALLVAIAVLLWFAKRAAGGEEESTGVWEALDADDDDDVESRASTERLRALARDDDSAIVVVEQETAPERRRKGAAAAAPAVEADEETSATGAMPAIDDTFSSDTALNLDQSDPIAEADFHMAYGLYDQAADLINGALAVEPERQDLMAKLCEIYFVWGNRDAFVDAASRLHDQLGGETSPDWDKIVIMGQQIAEDHRLFSGVSPASVTRAVDLSFDDSGEGGGLDMDFDSGGPDGAVSDVIDLGAEEQADGDVSGLDFVFDADEAEASAEDRVTGATTTREMAPRTYDDEATAESPTIESQAASEATVESPTVQEPLESLESTSELPAFRDGDSDTGHSGDATAEIDLDDLGLDLDALEQSGLGADLDDADSEVDFELPDADETTESPALDADDETGRNQGLDDLDSTSEMPFADESTGKNPALSDDEHDETDVEFDSSLLDATGHTQVLSDDFGMEADNDATMLAPLDDGDGDDAAARSGGGADFDFAETEALPKDSWQPDASDRASGQAAGNLAGDETGELPRPGAGGVDLDLDDLTAALRVSDGDTVDQPRDDETVDQPLREPGADGEEEVDTPTAALSPDDLSDDLHDARTMTEVGTKLDLARAYVDMGDPDGARSILEEVLDEGDEGQRQQAQKLIDSLPE